MKARTPLTFQSIHVDRMPGFPPELPFKVPDLTAGINIVTGPNMSGKTTLANALDALLWPDLAADRTEVTGRFRMADGEWTVAVEEGRFAVCEKDGQPTRPRELQSSAMRESYHLSLVDMLQAGADGRFFAERIAQEAAGGFDIGRAVASVVAQSPRSGLRSAANSLRDARAGYKDVRQSQQRLVDRARTLAGLQADRERSLAARDEVQRLKAALDVSRHKAMLAEREAELDAFPEAVRSMTGDEDDKLQILDRQLQAEQQEILSLREVVKRAQAAAAATGLEGDGVPEAVITANRSRLAELSRLGNTLEQLERELAQAQSARQQEATFPGFNKGIADNLPHLEAGALIELSELAERAERLSGRDRAAESLERLLARQAVEPQVAAAKLTEGVHLLVRWLSVPARDAPVRPGAAVWMAVGLAALGAILLGALVHWSFLSLLLLSLVAGWLVLRPLGKAGGGEGARDLYRRDFRKLDIGNPEDWSAQSVINHLADLEEQLAAVHLAGRYADKRNELEQERKRNDADRKKLEIQREELLARCGVAPELRADLNEAAFCALMKRVSAWHEAKTAESSARAGMDTAQVQQQELVRAVNGSLMTYGCPSGQDREGLDAELQDLAGRQKAYALARHQLVEAESRLADYKTRIADLAGRRLKIFADLGVDEGDAAMIKNLVTRLKDYGKKDRQVFSVREKLEDAMGNLLDCGGSLDLANELPDVLALRLAAAQDAEDSLEKLVEEISTIKTELDAARKGTGVMEAMAEMQEAAATLEQFRERDSDVAVTGVLGDYLQERVDRSLRSPLFMRAAELFVKFTSGRCELHVKSMEPVSLRVYDQGRPDAKALAELSAGTRLQLLLAVRLAFLESQEGDVALPVLLDELLANSDEERSLAIVEAVAGLAAEGRQVFYFTAQQDEVDKWIRMCEHLKLEPPNVIRLGELRKQEAAATLPLAGVVHLPPTPPEPNPGESYADYGLRLVVPGVDPRDEDSGALHLWHLLESPEVLHRLLCHHVTTWGRFRIWRKWFPDGLTNPDAETVAGMEASLEAIELATEQWRTGRGKPITRQVLRASGSVSDTFIERVSKLAQDCNRDADSLLTALKAGEAKRFSGRKLEELQDYLEHNGYLDTRPQVTEADARVAVIGRVSRHLDSGLINPQRVATLVARIYAFSR
jgi:energy-coupling factor transporter ATP-binding protein EcfA2